jgi:hypothetical protein
MAGGDERCAGASAVFAGRRRCFSKGDTKTASARRAVTRLEGLVTARRTGAGAGAGAGAVPRTCVRACERRDGGRRGVAGAGCDACALNQKEQAKAGVWWWSCRGWAR